MQNSFVMYCKTYLGDIKSFDRMIKTFNKFNVENIIMFVSIPQDEIDFFKPYQNNTVKLISDESYAKNYFTNEKYFGLSMGYVNQEICKLCFWETNFATNYLCIDSDLQFIRDFYIKDFMATDEIPYTVLVQDKNLAIEKHYHNFWLWRYDLIKKIYDEIELKDERYRTCHGMQVMNSKVLKSLKEDFMAQKKYSYSELIKISPYEFTWYNAWFQKCKLIEEYAVEPFFKTFHMRIEYIISRLKYLKLEDYAYSYVGIILNGNWQRPETKYKNPNFIEKFVYRLLQRL